MELFLCVLGMVMVVEGLPCLGSPDAVKAAMRVIQEQDDTTLRLIGGVLAAVGLVIIYVARQGLGPG